MIQRIKRNRRVVQITALFVIVSIALMMFFYGAANAENINQTNPKLELAIINSRVEEVSYSVPAYDAVGTFDQKGDTYTLDTNAYVVWRTEDDVAFAYNKYDIGGKATDTLTVETGVNERSNPNGGGLFNTASVGLMMRESLDPKSPQIFLHCREGGIAIVYRTQYGGSTYVKYSDMTASYPVSLKIVKKGTQYTCYYKNAGMPAWSSIAPVGVNIQGPTLAGVGAHATNGPTAFIRGVFKGFSAVGSGTYDSSENNSSNTESTVSEEPPIWQDAPIGSDVMLSETFTDGKMTNLPESISNPLWNSPAGENIITLENQNRVWHKNFTTSRDFLGSQSWTDYSASVDLSFTKNCDPEVDNIFRFYVRHRDISYLGMYDYYIQLSAGDTISVYRRFRSSSAAAGTRETYAKIENYLIPNQWHKLYVEAVDNTLKVYWDNKLVIDYVDTTEALANLKGAIGIETYDTDVYIDNIVVKKLNDEFGGDYDNDIGGNFDQKVPDYLEDWSNEGYAY